MTSLQEQLKRLSVPQGRAVASARDRRHKSILFDPKEAASFDRDTIHAIGINGLQELQTIDPSFEEFEGTLFSEGAKTLERSVQTEEVNKVLNRQIRTFLLRLSPYFSLKPAQKTLEWLVYRFAVHEYNIDDVMMCIIPYHTTKLFVRVVQLFNLKDKAHVWHWLRPIQDPGVPLARPTVLTHCYKDPAFLQFVCNLVPATIRAYKSISDQNPTQVESTLRLTFSFYASTVIGAMEQSASIQEEFLANLVPFLTKGLKSSYLDYKAGTLMVISQLCAKAKLEARLLHPIMETMCKKSDPALSEDLISCLAVVYQTQDLTDMQDSVFQKLCESPDLVVTLAKLSSERDTSPLLQVLLQKGVTMTLVSDIRVGVTDHNQGPQALIEEIISKIDFKVTLARSFIKFLLKTLLKTDENMWSTSFFTSLISNLEKKYPEAMDSIIQNQASKKLSSQKERRLQTIMHMTAGGSKHQVVPKVETSLVLSLNHPNSENRELAVKHLHTLNESGQIDPEFLQSSLSLRIEDSDQKVILAVLEFGEVLCEVLSPDLLMTKLEQHLSKWHRKTKDLWPQVASKSLSLLTSAKLWWNDSAKDRAAAVVLPYLLPSIPERASQDADIFHQIVTSDLGRSHDLFKGLSHVGKKQKGHQSKKSAPQVLEEIAHNLSGYPTEKRLQLVKFLVGYSSTHHLPGAYKLTVSLVLSELLKVLNNEDKLDVTEALLGSLIEDLGQVKEKRLKGQLPQTEGGARPSDGPVPAAVTASDGPVPAAVTDALGTLMTQRAMKGKKVSPEWFFGSLWCIKAIVHSMRKMEKIGAGDQWLHFERTTAEGRYFLTLVKLFDLVTIGATSSIDADITEQFKDVLGQLVQKTFDGTDQLWRFLSALCLSHLRLHGDGCHDISYLLQVCSLQMANISFGTAEEERLTAVLEKDSVVFICLLLNLGHPSESVRRVTVDCLNTIQERCRTATPYGQLIKAILKREGEVIVDPRYLQQALKLAVAKIEGEGNKRKSKSVSAIKGIISWLATCITAETTPIHIRCALMESLALVESKALLMSVVPSLAEAVTEAVSAEGPSREYNWMLARSILHHYRPYTADLLGEKQCQDALWLCMSQESLVREGMSLQSVALEQVTPDLFLTLPSLSIQQGLFSHLVALGLETKSAETVKMISRKLRKLPLSSELIINELNSLQPGKKLKTLHDARESRRRKQQKRTDEAAAKVSERSWERATFILELLQQRKLSKMEGVVKIVPTLFSILALCLEADDQLDSHEYIKQLVLTIIHSICQLKDDQSATQLGSLKQEQFNIELVVQCVRTSDNPQTHNHALLVLTVAAQLFPEHLLHNIMSIFTFMGASVLRQDDGYSFQIINKTLQTVIPALLKANSDGALPKSLGASVHNIVFMIIRVFVDAFPHIPDHRKLPLFTQLIETVHPEEYLWSCIVLLVESFASKGATALYPEEEAEESKGVGRSQLFWQSLCLHFSPPVQISAITRMFKFLSSLPEDTSTAPSGNQTQKFLARLEKLAEQEEGGFGKILDLRRFSGKQLRQFKFTLVGFFSQLLSSEEFIAKLASLPEDETTSLQDLYQILLEENLRFAQRIAQSGESNAENATAKFWKALLHRTYDVLDKVNALLPGDVFIRVVSGLLSNKLSSVRRKAMELLNNVLVQHRQRFTEDETAHLLGLVGRLITIAESRPDAASPEVEVNRQTALYSLKLLCKLLASESPRQFAPVLTLNLSILQAERENTQLASSALLCLAETVSSLRAHSIPHLSHMVPSILVFLEETKQINSSNLLLLCGVTAVQKTVETLPNFMSPYVKDILKEICRLSCNKDDEKTQLNIRLKGCRQMLSKKLPSRVLLPAVAQTYSTTEGTHRSSIVPLMTILEEHISSSTKEDILSHHSSLLKLYLDALDFRTNHKQVSLEEVATIEGAVIQAILMHIMKLSENTFRPMYYQMFDWASRNNPPRSRLLTFYNLSDAIAERLKSIFPLFAGHIVPNCAELLDANNSIKEEEQFFTDDDEDSARSNLLVQFILSCLCKCFLHDKGAFINKERFELLSQPLIDQLENTHGREDDYEGRVANYLGPCITALLSSVGDQGIWQPINYQLLLKMRHSSSKVRYAALVVLDQVHQSMKESYLSLLPETIPFLAELMEDESEEVERKCHELVKDFEKTLGEPLQKHF